MIRKLSESDRAQLLACLRRTPQTNIYMLGNLASLGVDHEISEFWGDFAPHTGSASHHPGTEDTSANDAPRLRGVINRYMTGWSVTGDPDTDWAGLAAVLDTYPTPAERLQDNPIGVESFLPYLQKYVAARVETEEMMTLDADDFRPVPVPPGFVIRPACFDDLDALTAFYADAQEMRRSRPGVERPLRDGYLWLAEPAAHDGATCGATCGTICGAALTNAVGDGHAMIGGVYTAPAWRGRGISQAVCSALCAALLQAALRPTLYWIAADAGHVYRKLGFHAIGHWRSAWLQQRMD